MTLTREQVHEILIGLWTAVGGDQARQDGLAVMATDAALRERVADLTAKLAKVEQSREEWKAGWYALSHDSGQQLEALTARIRTSTQLIIETIGSCGPEDLEEAIGRIVARVADLTAKLAKKQQECDEHVENLSRCKGNELAEQLAQAEEEIAFWKLQAVDR